MNCLGIDVCKTLKGKLNELPVICYQGYYYHRFNANTRFSIGPDWFNTTSESAQVQLLLLYSAQAPKCLQSCLWLKGSHQLFAEGYRNVFP